MANVSRTDAATSLRLLSEVSAARVPDLEQYNDDDGLTTESDDDANSESPILDQFYEEGGQDGIHQMTNFTTRELNNVYEILSDDLEYAWCSGRGKKSAYTCKDAFFMLLTTLKHSGNWDF